tara:strand:- start:53 stop:388 length:336 start_codon:yes stop_codon:yes gene_type:complete
MEGEEVPRTFFGVGGYKLAPNSLTDPLLLDSTRQRMHMISDELVNKCCTLIEQEKNNHVVKEISNSELSADQLRAFAQMIAEGKYESKASSQHLDDGSRIITFTLTNLEEN